MPRVLLKKRLLLTMSSCLQKGKKMRNMGRVKGNRRIKQVGLGARLGEGGQPYRRSLFPIRPEVGLAVIDQAVDADTHQEDG